MRNNLLTGSVLELIRNSNKNIIYFSPSRLINLKITAIVTFVSEYIVQLHFYINLIITLWTSNNNKLGFNEISITL